ncbi:MAG: fatty acid cis/trans isomerase [Bdellovibrionota bacterium]|nr:fatty acid cis/trans isomerase [Bdellovibrionota bacterium]
MKKQNYTKNSISFVALTAIALLFVGINFLFAETDTRNKSQELVNKKIQFYEKNVQSIFDGRCIACHSCFNAPCQLKLTSYEGLKRGASKNDIFDFNDIKAKSPSRLYIDAHSEHAWRKKDFFPVVGDGSAYLLLKMVNGQQGVESKLQKEYLAEESRVCPQDGGSEDFAKYMEKNPAGRMPYGLPGLEKKDITNIMKWISDGSNGPVLRELEAEISKSDKFKEKINQWEVFFNRPSMKAKLVSRYFFEHLFLADIYFEEHPEAFFRLVRSKTKVGEIEEIASVFPFDDPGKDFYYRMRPVTESLVHKANIPFLFSEKRREKWEKDFFQGKWKEDPKVMPPYGKLASNPFETFKAVPVKARYEFFLENSAYHVMTFIKGPVCKGQTAVNVINDHFWVFFVDPSKDVLVNSEKAYKEVTESIKFPSAIADDFKPLVDFRDNYWRSVEAKFRHVDEFGDLDRSWLWNGKRENTNVALSIFRHFNSASILRGLRGEIPKTVWVLDYHVFESIYYNLTAGYNVFGPILHQLNSRLFMEISRVASEDLFLSFLDKSQRQKLREQWTQKVPKQKESITKRLVDVLTNDAREKLSEKYVYQGSRFQVNNPLNKQGFLQDLKANHYSRKQLLIDQDAKDFFLKQIESLPAGAVQYLPDAIMLSWKGKLWTLVHNKDHYNVAMLFFEDDRRRPEKDSITLIRGMGASYANLMMKLDEQSMIGFVSEMKKAKSKDAVYKILRKYAMSRADSKFWELYDELNSQTYNPVSKERGVIDLNRYMNL